ncbi:MAG: T9SS type A sorting domain-containing protein [Bacteroidota bacterium]
MKTKLLILSIFILTSFAAKTQQYKPIPDSNATWVIKYWDGATVWKTEYFFLKPFKDDTTINSFNYHKLYKGDSSLYTGAYRNDPSEKVFFVPKDSLIEYLLYDFGVQAGDTVYNVYGVSGFNEPVLFNAKIDYVGNINLGNNYFVKEIDVRGFWNSLNYNNFTIMWMEKIGGQSGIISSPPVNDYYQLMPLLDCVDIIDTIFCCPCCTVGHCDKHPLVVTQDYILPAYNINTYPNPTDGSINIDLQGYIDFNNESIIYVYNYSGSLIFQQSVSKKEVLRLNLGQFGKGIFFLLIIDGINIKTEKIIVD